MRYASHALLASAGRRRHTAGNHPTAPNIRGRRPSVDSQA